MLWVALIKVKLEIMFARIAKIYQESLMNAETQCFAPPRHPFLWA
jgi:hypothetical protein